MQSTPCCCLSVYLYVTAWLDWGLSGWLTTLLQWFDTVGWVIRPVKHRLRNDLNCVEWDVKPGSTQSVCHTGGPVVWIVLYTTFTDRYKCVPVLTHLWGRCVVWILIDQWWPLSCTLLWQFACMLVTPLNGLTLTLLHCLSVHWLDFFGIVRLAAVTGWLMFIHRCCLLCVLFACFQNWVITRLLKQPVL